MYTSIGDCQIFMMLYVLILPEGGTFDKTHKEKSTIY